MPDLNDLSQRFNVDRTWLEDRINEGREILELTMQYEEREIPFLIVGMSPVEYDQFIDNMSEFMWKIRHLAN